MECASARPTPGFPATSGAMIRLLSTLMRARWRAAAKGRMSCSLLALLIPSIPQGLGTPWMRVRARTGATAVQLRLQLLSAPMGAGHRWVVRVFAQGRMSLNVLALMPSSTPGCLEAPELPRLMVGRLHVLMRLH